VTASWSILEGDCRDVLRSLDDGSVQTCVTSPPYFGLRDYGHDGQIGLEPTPDEFVAALVGVFREVRRVLRDDGTVWLNLGDSYNNRARVRPSSHQPGLNSVIDSSWSSAAARAGCRMSLRGGDLKEKDLLGIPWMTGVRLARRWLVSPERHHLEQASVHARERDRSSDASPRVPVPALEIVALLLQRRRDPRGHPRLVDRRARHGHRRHL
jgi:hypothetical protein